MTAELKALFGKLSEWNAERVARNKYNDWRKRHPTEQRILELVDMELKYSTPEDNPRRKQLYLAARAKRRSLGFPDEFLTLVSLVPFQLEEKTKGQSELSTHALLPLLRSVNEGLWLRAGHDTPGITRLRRLG